MNCGVCILLLRVLRRGGGGGGESEDDVTEMTSSGSGSQFLLRRGGGEDSEGEGRKRGVFDARRGGTSDEERREVPACSGWFCHVAYCMRTCRTGIEKHTHLYVVFIMRMICTHLDVGGGRTLLYGVCMRARTQENVGLGHTSIRPLSRSRSGPTVSISMSLPGAGSASSSSSRPNDAWLPLSAVLIVAVCAASSRGFDVDSLDGTAKGDGETDDDADATWAWVRGAGIVVAFL